MSAWAIASERVFLGGSFRPATLWIQGEKIARITEGRAPGARDVSPHAILPGIVDTHAHINEPGRTEWEGFTTATQAAAAGGITTVVDMPLNSIPPTTTVANLAAKRAEAQGRTSVDLGFWGGVIPGNTAELAPLVRAGARGFKAFMIDSGVPEFPPSPEATLEAAMRELAKLDVPLLLHAELELPVPPSSGDPRAYTTFVNSRPPSWEVQAIALAIDLCRRTRCRTHIVHLSAAEALPLLKEAQSQGLPITAETCPHYLVLDAEHVPTGATAYKCCPPIRSKRNQDALWEGLLNGTLSCVVSDHSPCTPALKLPEEGDFMRAWGGIAGLQWSLPLVWAEAQRRGLRLEQVLPWMTTGPAKLAGLPSKGRLLEGADADIVVFDTDMASYPGKDRTYHRHPVTPYASQAARGRTLTTYLRGAAVYDALALNPHTAPRGRLLQ